MMQAAGETLGSLSTGFADLLSLGSEGAASSESSSGNADNLDPASRLQALGKSLFEALKNGGWPADQPIELKLDATGQLSTSSASMSNVALVDPTTGKPTRVGVRLLPDGSKERFSKKSGASLGKIAPPRTKKTK